MKTNQPVLLRGLSATLMIALLLLVLGGGTRASAQVVTNTGDSGPGTLRDAIINATNGATITFATNLSGATITLSNTLTIKTNLTIDGSALPGGIQINGNASVQVFNVTIQQHGGDELAHHHQWICLGTVPAFTTRAH